MYKTFDGGFLWFTKSVPFLFDIWRYVVSVLAGARMLQYVLVEISSCRLHCFSHQSSQKEPVNTENALLSSAVSTPAFVGMCQLTNVTDQRKYIKSFICPGSSDVCVSTNYNSCSFKHCGRRDCKIPLFTFTV